jgi:ribosomal protein S18 acetylase RimI-like enzyme
MEVTYRLCDKSDRQKVADFHIPNHLEVSVRNEFERKVQTDDLPADFPGLFSDELFAKDTTIIAEKDGRIVGCIGLEAKTADQCYINNFSTDKNVRKQGIGSKLMEMVLKVASEQGYKKAYLITLPDVMLDACRLYERFGFIKTAVKKGNAFMIATYEKDL